MCAIFREKKRKHGAKFYVPDIFSVKIKINRITNKQYPPTTIASQPFSHSISHDLFVNNHSIYIPVKKNMLLLFCFGSIIAIYRFACKISIFIFDMTMYGSM